MAVNWALGVPQNDVGQSFQQGYQNALLRGQQAEDRQLQMQQREQAQVQQKQQQQVQVTEQHQQAIRAGARIVRQMNPQDQAGWQQVLAAAQQANIPLDGVPQQFDPNYVRQLLAAGQALETQSPQQPTAFQQDLIAAGIQPNSPQGQRLLRNRYAAPPRVIMGPNNQPMLVQEDDGGGAPPPPTTPDIIIEDDHGNRQRFNPQTHAWEPVTAQSGAAPDWPVPGGAASGQRNFQP